MADIDEEDEGEEEEFKDCDSVIEETKSLKATSPASINHSPPKIITTAPSTNANATATWSRLKTVMRSVSTVKSADGNRGIENDVMKEPLRKRASTSAAFKSGRRNAGNGDVEVQFDVDEGQKEEDEEGEVLLRRSNGIPGRKRKIKMRQVWGKEFVLPRK